MNDLSKTSITKSNFRPKIEHKKVFEGCPTFFRACCAEARKGGLGHSYRVPGYHLGLHCFELVTGSVPDSKMDALERLLSARDSDINTIWEWLVENLPRCMALVPVKRKNIFVEGFLEATEIGW